MSHPVAQVTAILGRLTMWVQFEESLFQKCWRRSSSSSSPQVDCNGKFLQKDKLWEWIYHSSWFSPVCPRRFFHCMTFLTLIHTIRLLCEQNRNVFFPMGIFSPLLDCKLSEDGIFLFLPLARQSLPATAVPQPCHTGCLAPAGWVWDGERDAIKPG